jgi:F-type H+-transporting ATPase subunit delta
MATDGRRAGCEKRKSIIVASSSPIVSGIAGRYALALFELAKEAKGLDKVGEALDSFARMLDSSEDLDRLVRSPVYSADEQVAALTGVLKKAKIDGLAANFLKLVAAKRRLFAVRGMIAGYRALVAEEQGVVSAEVTVAAPLSDKNRDAVLKALESQAGKKVSLTEKVDPAIIGGLVVKMGSRMIDASLRTKLSAMKLAMNQG